MMKKTLTERLLTLHKETLRNLSARDLENAEGGAPTTCGTSSDPTFTYSRVQHPTACDC
jgi:hypothetical protein